MLFWLRYLGNYVVHCAHYFHVHYCAVRVAWKETVSKIPQAGSPGEEAFALHCRVEFHPLNQPEREFVFHPGRKWRFDFAWPSNMIAVEIEGRGRHQSFGGFEADCYKYNAAALLGWRVLRYTPAMVMRGDAINDMKEFSL